MAASKLELELQERRVQILRGISQDTPDLEIAKQIGVFRWMVVRDVRNMGYSGDPELKEALKARDRLRARKAAERTRNSTHVRARAGVPQYDRDDATRKVFQKHD